MHSCDRPKIKLKYKRFDYPSEVENFVNDSVEEWWQVVSIQSSSPTSSEKWHLWYFDFEKEKKDGT